MSRSEYFRRHVLVPLGSTIALLGAWSLLSFLPSLATVLPAPWVVAAQMVRDLGLYPRNIAVTAQSALLGYLAGNAIAIALVVVTLPFQRTQRLIERVAVGAVALPLIAVAPILAIAFSGNMPSIILAAQAVLFPTVVATAVGLRAIDRSSVEVILAAGGSNWTALRLARLPAAVPSVVAGLQIAAPSALLGAIIGEYMGGTQGLGVAMVQAQGSFEVARAWGIAIVIAAMAAVVYLAIPWLARALLPWARVTVTNLGVKADRIAADKGGWQTLLGFAISIALTAATVVACWWIAVLIVPGGAYVARGPLEVIPYLTSQSTNLLTAGEATAGTAWQYLLTALGQTFLDAGVGFVAGLVFAVVVAVLAFQWPAVEQALMPVSMVLRSVPIVAAMPLLAMIFGRGLLAVTVLVTIMTFFPTLVNLLVAMRNTPQSAIDLFTSVGAGRALQIRKLMIPYALPALMGSIKIALPMSIGAAMVAEWLATGQGLGASMTVAATISDYNFVWAGVVAVLLASLIAYHVAGLLESQALRRLS
jgi:ABC-type nitrate/sulfonate/bicarbonate transport system permease component